MVDVIPNTKVHIRDNHSSLVSYMCVYYDINGNFVSREGNGSITSRVCTIPANAYKLGVTCWTNKNYLDEHITVTPYYTEQQGGEGYDNDYSYEEPDIIDTGSEPLGAFDKKTPDGVITRGGTEDDFGDKTWRYYATNGIFETTLPLMRTTNMIAVCSKYSFTTESVANMPDKSFKFMVGFYTAGVVSILVKDSSAGTDPATFKTNSAGVKLEYPLATPTTEQGTSFRQYAGINDYGIMYWLDSNDELVSIPQGCKIQYPVNYKGFIDDAYMYTNGDATAIALKDDITDTALNARGYYKMQDLSSGVTLATGVTATLKKAYKHGNVITMSLVLQNTSSAELASYSTLFTLASGMFPANQYIVAYVEANNLLKRFRINPSGEGGIEYALPNSGVVYINISYAVA